MSRSVLSLLLIVAGAGCATTPEGVRERRILISEANIALEKMVSKDPSLAEAVRESAGYAVYPNVGKGGFLVGAALGSGVVFEDGDVVGYSNLNAGSVGAQVGGQAYDQLVLFRYEAALGELKSGGFQLSADASATVVSSGAAARAPFADGVAVFIDDEQGVMAEAAIVGQRLEFVPLR